MKIRTALLALILSLPGWPASAADGCPTEVTTPQPPTCARPERVERLMSAKPSPDARVLLVGTSGFVRWPKHLLDEALGAPSFRLALGADNTSGHND